MSTQSEHAYRKELEIAERSHTRVWGYRPNLREATGLVIDRLNETEAPGERSELENLLIWLNPLDDVGDIPDEALEAVREKVR